MENRAVNVARFRVVFILESTARYYGQPWSEDDYVVLTGGQIVGRIMLHPEAPQAQPWFWTMTAREQKPSTRDHGFSESREQAITDFKSQWLNNGVT
jgi:hypothetical protein